MSESWIKELQEALDRLSEDPAWKHNLIVLPASSKVESNDT